MAGWRSGVTAAVLIGGLTLAASAAADSPISMCVPSAGGAAITTPTSGSTCPAGSTFKQTASQTDLDAAKARIATLENVLAGVTRGSVNGRTTLTFSGENVRIVNGTGSKSTLNGLGNLIVGYNDTPRSQTGSHNIVLGFDQSFLSWGSIVGGAHNTSGSSLQGLLGSNNKASDTYAAITGGYGNLAESRLSSISGGCENTTGSIGRTVDSFCRDQTFQFQSVSGGRYNYAEVGSASVSGGEQNEAAGVGSSITGGNFNHASGDDSSIHGGYENQAQATLSSILGGCENMTGNTGVPSDQGSCQNGGTTPTVAGGALNLATGAAASVTGGWGNWAEGVQTAILGGNSSHLTATQSTYPAGP
jgi:hypothetical protein